MNTDNLEIGAQLKLLLERQEVQGRHTDEQLGQIERRLTRIEERVDESAREDRGLWAAHSKTKERAGELRVELQQELRELERRCAERDDRLEERLRGVEQRPTVVRRRQTAGIVAAILTAAAALTSEAVDRLGSHVAPPAQAAERSIGVGGGHDGR